MLCSKCDRRNPDGAQFCDACGVPLPTMPQPAGTGTTGPTVVLGNPAPPPPAVPTSLAGVPGAAPGQRVRLRQANGGVWLIGIGLLFLTHTFWPGILVLAGISGYLEEMAQRNQEHAVRTLLFMVGLALLFQFNWFWPGILLLAGLTAIISPEIRSRHS